MNFNLLLFFYIYKVLDILLVRNIDFFRGMLKVKIVEKYFLIIDFIYYIVEFEKSFWYLKLFNVFMVVIKIILGVVVVIVLKVIEF